MVHVFVVKLWLKGAQLFPTYVPSFLSLPRYFLPCSLPSFAFVLLHFPPPSFLQQHFFTSFLPYLIPPSLSNHLLSYATPPSLLTLFLLLCKSHFFVNDIASLFTLQSFLSFLPLLKFINIFFFHRLLRSFPYLLPSSPTCQCLILARKVLFWIKLIHLSYQHKHKSCST